MPSDVSIPRQIADRYVETLADLDPMVGMAALSLGSLGLDDLTDELAKLP